MDKDHILGQTPPVRHYSYASQPEVEEISMPVISKVDAGAFFDVRVELERLRKTCPPNTSVTAGVVRVQGCAKELGKTCCAANGAMSPEVRRDLIRTAAEVMRVLTEKCQ